MVNPRVLSSDALHTNASLVQLKRGVMVAARGLGEGCDLDETAVIEQNGVQYRFDQRFSYFQNLPLTLRMLPGVCAEEYSSIGAKYRAKQSTQKTKVYEGEAFVADLVAEDIQPWRDAFPSPNIDLRQEDDLGVDGPLSSRLSRFLRIREGGLYTFFLQGHTARVSIGTIRELSWGRKKTTPSRSVLDLWRWLLKTLDTLV